MNCKLLLSLVVLITTFYSKGASQLLAKEFLDHTDVETILNGFEIINSNILFVTQNNRDATTDVKIFSEDNQLVSILNSPIEFRTKSKFFKKSKDDLSIYLYDLKSHERDNFSANIYEIKYFSEEIKVNEIVNNFMHSFETVVSMTIDSLDNIIALTSLGRLQTINNSILIDENQINHQTGELYNNSKSGVYFIDNNRKNIFKVIDLELNHFLSFNEIILDIKEIETENLVLLENKLIVYKDDFSCINAEIGLPFSIESLDQIEVLDNEYYLLQQSNSGFKVFKTGINQPMIEIFSKDEDFGTSSSIKFITNSTFITGGNFQVQDISSNTFFKKHSLEEEMEVIRPNVELVNFELSYVKDTFIFGFPDIFIYKANYSYKNNSNFNIKKSDVYSSRYIQSLSNSRIFHQNNNILLHQNEQITIDTTIWIAFTHPDPLMVSIPGIDYKFNSSEQSIIQIDLTTEIDELIFIDLNNIYPNPFNEKLYLDLGNYVNNISIFNSSGRLVYYTEEINKTEISTGFLNKGIYYIVIQSNHGNTSKKLVKLK